METLASLDNFLSAHSMKLKRIQVLVHCTKLWVFYVDGCYELEETSSM